MVLCAAFSACAHALISKDLRQRASSAPFGRVVSDPGMYTGETFIWGGTIVKTTTVKEGSRIEVLQNPLDKKDMVKSTDETQGRFIVATSKFLDPAVYAGGRLITVAGRLEGVEKGKIDELEYSYPVLEALELRLYSRERRAYFMPSIFIGVGGSF